MNLGEIVAKFRLDTKEFTAGIESVKGGFTDTEKKSQTLMQNLKGHWMAISASVVGAYMAIGKASEYMKLGAMANQAEESFRLVATSAGESADKILEAMNRAAAGTVDDSDIMQKAVKGMVMGFSGDQLIKIMETARVSARVAGEDVKTAYENITDAIATNMPKALKKYGLIAKDEMALVNKALAAGMEDVNLYEIAMAHATLQAAKMGGVQDNAAEQIQRTRAQWNELTETIGKALLVALQKVTGGFQWVAAGSLGAAAAAAKFLAVTIDIAAWTVDKLGFTEKAAGMRAYAESVKKTAKDLGGAAEELAGKAAANMAGIGEASTKTSQAEIDNAKKIIEQWKKSTEARIAEAEAAKKAAQEKEAAEKAIVEAIRKAQIEIESINKTQYEKDLIRIDSEAGMFRKAKADEINVVKFVEKEKALVIAQSNEAIRVLREKAEDEFIQSNYKRLEEQTKAIQDAKDADVKIYLEAIDAQNKSGDEFILANYDRLDKQYKEEQELFDNEKKLTIERITLEAGLYADLKGYGNEYYEAQKKLIAQRIKDLKQAGVDEKAILAMSIEENFKADQKKLLDSENFWDGIRAGYNQDIKDQKKWGEQGDAIWKDFTTRRKQFSNEFVDNFIAGQNLMLSIQEAAGNMAVGLAGDISKRMWAAAIEKIIGMIGAHIGGGAALVAWQGANKGGVAGALAEIGIFLGSGVAAMLAGRAMAQQFRAEGGWVGAHPNGGWVREGSGNKDDVFLGYTPGVRHWGMGGEFVVNKESSQKHAPLLEAINRDRAWDEGGSVGIDKDAWKPVSQSLGIGCGASFLHGFLTKGGFWGGITEAIAFNATAIPSMFAGKYLSNQFKADGGWMDVGHGWGSFFSSLVSPFHGVTSALSSAFNATIGNLPGLGQYIPNPFVLGQIMTDPKEAERVLREMIQQPYEQVAKDIMTPGKYYSDPIDVVTNNIKNLGHVWETFTGATLPGFRAGIDYVPQTGPAMLHQGERVISREDNVRGGQPLHITLELNGRVLSEYIYNETKRGNKMIHSRGLAG